ncbi:MAG: Rrf2 family transcriptional regulator [Phycisphaeraceae bacterium]
MLGLSRKTDYALVALARLAEQTRAQGGTVSARRIAEAYALPLPLIMSVLKRLHHAGIVASTRGPQGGYSLVQRPDQLTIARVVDAIEGPVQIALCCQEDEDDTCLACQLMNHCPITDAIRRLNQRVIAFLDQVTLEDLLKSDVDVPVPLVGIAVHEHVEELP